MPTRLSLLAAVATAAVAGAALGLPAAQAAPKPDRGPSADHTATVTVLGTTDLHGNVLNWDYYKNAAYSDSAKNAIGLARGLDPRHAGAGEAGPGHHPARRRRRHDPGHAARVLLRQGRPDHERAPSTRWPPP